MEIPTCRFQNAETASTFDSFAEIALERVRVLESMIAKSLLRKCLYTKILCLKHETCDRGISYTVNLLLEGVVKMGKSRMSEISPPGIRSQRDHGDRRTPKSYGAFTTSLGWQVRKVFTIVTHPCALRAAQKRAQLKGCIWRPSPRFEPCNSYWMTSLPQSQSFWVLSD